MSIEIGVIVGIIGVILSAAAFFSGRYTAQAKKGQDEGKLEAKVDQVGRDVRDIKEDLSGMRQEQGELRDRITRLETVFEMIQKREAH